MRNSICSPEMDLSDNIDMEPHAYIQYAVDEQKASIPLTFFKEFPKDWREKKWKRDYLYKAFWNPDETDSPAEMLKRVPVIPVFDSDVAVLSRPGYYRASVLAVEESKSALESLVDSKRLSVGLLKYMHTSFDNNLKRDSSKSQQVDSEANTTSSKRKKKGINLEAQKRNTANLKEGLSAVYPFIKSEPRTSSGKRKSDESDNSKKTSASPTDSKRQRKPRGKGSVNYTACYETDSDEANVIDGKKVDPDFTPKKYLELQEKLKASENNLEKAYETNRKLRQSLALSESENTTLGEKVKSLEWELEEVKRGGVGVKKALFDDTESSGDSRDGNFDSVVVKTAKMSDSDSEDEEKERGSKLEEVVKKEEKEKDNNEEKAVNCNVNQDCLKQMDTKVNVKTEQSSEFTVGGVSIQPDVWKLIFELPKGPKKDIQFIKDLSTVVHGPETLAASSIFGTMKGGKKRLKEERTPKPALNKKLLRAVRAELVKRVEKDEGITIPFDDIDSHERTKASFYHEAIRGAQKRLKSMGYGNGNKSNTVLTDILMSAE